MGPHGRNMGMPLSVFTDAAWRGLAEGSDHVIVGTIGPGGKEEKYNEVIKNRREIFEWLSKIMRG